MTTREQAYKKWMETHDWTTQYDVWCAGYAHGRRENAESILDSINQKIIKFSKYSADQEQKAINILSGYKETK